MPKLLFLSDNNAFAEDLTGQIELYAPEFVVHREPHPETAYDVYLLDEQNSHTSGIQPEHHRAPMIWLEKTGEDQTEICDSDLVIYKPFCLGEFLNKLRSSINRFENSSEGFLLFNRYELHPQAKEILNLRNNELIKLTEKEVAVIKYLYKSKDRIVSKNDLLQNVWDYNSEVTTHTIETHIYRLRQKVEHENAAAQLILTEEGGYKLNF